MQGGGWKGEHEKNRKQGEGQGGSKIMRTLIRRQRNEGLTGDVDKLFTIFDSLYLTQLIVQSFSWALGSLTLGILFDTQTDTALPFANETLMMHYNSKSKVFSRCMQQQQQYYIFSVYGV